MAGGTRYTHAGVGALILCWNTQLKKGKMVAQRPLATDEVGPWSHTAHCRPVKVFHHELEIGVDCSLLSVALEILTQQSLSKAEADSLATAVQSTQNMNSFSLNHSNKEQSCGTGFNFHSLSQQQRRVSLGTAANNTLCSSETVQ